MLLQPRRAKRLKKPPSRTRGLIVKVAIVVLVLVVVEVAARSCVDAVASRSIETNEVDVRDVTVASGDVPVVFHYWLLGGLKNGSLTMHDISASPMNISRLEVSAEDLRFNRIQLLKAKARLDGSPPYRVTMALSASNLSDVLHTSVTFRGGHLIAQIDGDNIDVVPQIDGRTIVLRDERNTHEIDLPGTEYLPCEPTSIGVSGGIVVSCDSDELPPFVAEATR